VIPADRVRWGAVNTLAIRVARDKSNNGDDPILGNISLVPKLCTLTLRPAGGTVEQERLPARFDMGAQPPAAVELVFRLPARLLGDKSAQLSHAVTDFYFRTLALGQARLSADMNGQAVAVVRLGKEETRKLYYSEFFEYQVSVINMDGSIPAAETARVTDLCYADRDAKALPPLPETWEETSYGRLKLVDEIDCAADPAIEGHPYKEGGITWNRWALRNITITGRMAFRLRTFSGGRAAWLQTPPGSPTASDGISNPARRMSSASNTPKTSPVTLPWTSHWGTTTPVPDGERE
jgi:hypothetical protein